MTTNTISIYNLVRGDGAFKNSAEPLTQVAIDEIAIQISAITALEAIPDDNGYDNGIAGWSSADFTNLLGELANLDTSLYNFLEHTNRISGTTFNDDFLTQRADLNSLLSVSSSLHQLQIELGVTPDDVVNDFFGSLISSMAELNTSTVFLIDLDIKIQAGDATVADTTSNINLFISYLDNLVVSENQNFDDAVRQLRAWGISNIVESPDDLYRVLVEDTISTDELKVLID